MIINSLVIWKFKIRNNFWYKWMARELLGFRKQFEIIGGKNTWWCMRVVGALTRAVFGLSEQIQWMSQPVLKYVQRHWRREAKRCLIGQRNCWRDGC